VLPPLHCSRSAGHKTKQSEKRTTARKLKHKAQWIDGQEFRPLRARGVLS